MRNSTLTRKIKTSFPIAVVLFLLLANSSNPPNGRTGAPGDGRCSDCHGGNNFAGDVEIEGLPGTIMTGETVTLTVNVNNTDGNAVRAGFQVVALFNDGNTNAGDFSESSADIGTQNANGREYVEHRGAKNFSNNSASWTFDWTAPNSPGDVTLYAAGNITNGGGSSGDAAKFASFETTVEGEQVDPLMASISKSDISCNGEEDGSASVSASGGTPPYSYDWNNGSSNASINNLTPGMYSVTISDNAGEEVMLEVIIGEPDAINIDGIINDVQCSGQMNGSINITVSGGSGNLDYNWSNGANTQDISNLSPGDYTVMVSDDNDCSAEMTFSISVPDPLGGVINAVNESGDDANDGVAEIEVAGGTPPYQIMWSTGQSGNSISGLMPGEYSVTILDDNDCNVTYSFMIESFNCSFEANIMTTNVSCFGIEDGSAEIMVDNEVAPVTYDWSNGTTASTVSNLAPGDYDVMVTDGTGCTLLLMFTIDEPEDIGISFATTGIECNQDTSQIQAMITGGTPGYSVEWSTGETNPMIEAMAGIYSITVTDALGCVRTDSIEVIANDTVPPTILSYDTVVVFLDTLGQSLVHVSMVDTGSFDNCQLDTLLLSIDTLGCADLGFMSGVLSAIDDAANISTKEIIFEVVDTIAPTAVCPNTIFVTACTDTVEYDIPLAFDNCSIDSISLAEGLPSGSIFPVDSTKVSYNFYDQSGNFHCCSFWVVVEDSLRIQIDSVNQAGSEQGGSIEVTVSGGEGPYNYSWTLLDSGEISTDEDVFGLQPGAYLLTVTASNGCLATSQVILIDETTSSYAVNDGLEELKIYPNPVDWELNIVYEGEIDIADVVIISSTGQVISTANYKINKTNRFDVSNFPQGIYFLVISSGEGVISRKFVKQ